MHRQDINFRHGSEGVYRWEFDKDTQFLTGAMNGHFIVDNLERVIRAPATLRFAHGASASRGKLGAYR
jgi:hypothetical protein